MRFFVSMPLLLLGVTTSALAQNAVVFVRPTPTLEDGALIALPIVIGIIAGWALHRRSKK
jgi:hypothetical protein